VDLIRKFISKFRRKPPAAPPPRLAGPPGDILIDSGMGADGSPAYVSEAARRQAAINMRLDPAKRAQVEVMLGEKLGSLVAGIKESKRRYPEAYADYSENRTAHKE
jgi:hypothetical protein